MADGDAIDAAEVAALEAAADETAPLRPQRMRPHAFVGNEDGTLCEVCDLSLAADLHMAHAPDLSRLTRAASSSVERSAEPREAAGSTPALPTPHPKGALETLVEAAVTAQLGPMAETLTIVARDARYAMHLLMVIADRLHIDRHEIAAVQKISAEVDAELAREAKERKR